MNAMTQAMLTAGVKLPSVKERLWRHIKDNPGCTRKELRAVFAALPEGTFSGQLSLLTQSGMVYERDEYINGRRRVRLFTDLEVYVWEGKPKKNERSRSGQCDTPSQSPAPRPPAPVDDFRAFIDNLTVAQARALYAELKQMFA